MTARGNPSLSTRAAPETHARVEAAAKRAGVPKANWVHEAILFALEADEAPTKPTPQAIRDATPRRAGNGRIVMPRGRVFEPR